MQANAETTTPKKRVFKKATTEIVKLEPGDKIQGKYVGKNTGPRIDKQTGEEKELTRLFFQRDDETKFILFEDGGLRNAMANAMVNEGDWLEIEKHEKTSIGGGRSVNQYDIYIAQ